MPHLPPPCTCIFVKIRLLLLNFLRNIAIVFACYLLETSSPFLLQLTDFGLSKIGLINSTDDFSGPSLSGPDSLGDNGPASLPKREHRQKQSVVGTPDYLAPEILLGMGHGL